MSRVFLRKLRRCNSKATFYAPIAPRFRPSFEHLETRLLLTTRFVVPGNVATDATHFHDLSSAITASNTHDIIQIEPNSVPGAADGTNGTSTINRALLTIQGDPSDGPSNLPQLGPVTVFANEVTLTNLNLALVNLSNGLVETTITNCLVATVFQKLGPSIGNSTVLTDNTFTGSVALGNTGSSNDRIVNNTFTGGNLELFQETGALVQSNTFTGSGIIATGSSASIVGNTIDLTGAGNFGIEFLNSGTGTIANNSISTSGQGTGIQIAKATLAANFSCAVSDNDLVLNQVGIAVEGDGTASPNAFGTIDLGGGTLGSPGGNDFHGFTGSGGHFSITTTNSGVATTASVSALDNIFSAMPASTISAGAGTINAGTFPAPVADFNFVAQLYNDFLRRSGSVAELSSWVNALPALATSGVAAAIIRSAEADARLIDALYLKILGRAADPGGEMGWVNMLQQGATEEQVANGLLTSAEFAARSPTLANAPATPNVDYIEALYNVLLGRTGSAGEIDGWLNMLPALGRSGVAGAILGSAEFRADVIGSLYFSNPTTQLVSLADIAPNLLHRNVAASPAEVAAWANSAMDILSIEAVFAGVSDGEFFNNG
jgi:hypothetical protein